MAELYNTRLYKQTHFDAVNRPATPAALSGSLFQDFPAVFKRQNKNLSSIRIDATWEDVEDVDYCSLATAKGTKYYIILSVSMLTDRTAELYLLYDPLLSVGGIDAINVSGWLRRCHVSSDGLFENILPEPWEPMDEMQIRGQDYLTFPRPQWSNPVSQKYRPFILTTCDLSTIQDYSEVIAQAVQAPDDGGTIIFPRLPEVTKRSTIFRMSPNGEPSNDNYYPSTVENLYAWPLTNADGTTKLYLQKALQVLRSLAVDSAIVGSYMLPASALPSYSSEEPVADIQLTKSNDKAENADLASYVNGNYAEVGILSGYEYTDGIQNKKVFALFSFYNIRSIAADSSASYEAKELYHDGDTFPAFRIFSDPSPQGTNYLAPVYFLGRRTRDTQHAIAGLPWLSYQVVTQGEAGALITSSMMRRNTSQEQIRYSYREGRRITERTMRQIGAVGSSVDNTIKSLLGMSGGSITQQGNTVTENFSNPSGLFTEGIFSSVAGGISADVMSYHDADADRAGMEIMQANNNLRSAMTSVAAPTINVAGQINDAAYFGNLFIGWHTTLSDADAHRLDRFLTLYGYAINKEFSEIDLSSRQYYNYIEADEAYVEGPKVTYSDSLLLSDLFKSGVRLWHTTPTAALMQGPNPIKEATV